MERVQFYPNESLKNKLEKDAKNKGISTSALVVEILFQYYNLTPENRLPFEDVVKQVFDEITEHIKNKEINYEFDLLTASETFRNIEMVADGKPSTNRARIGRRFAQNIKTTFPNIQPVRINNKIKKSQNNATIYKLIKNQNMPMQKGEIMSWDELMDMLFPNCLEEEIEDCLCDIFLNRKDN